MADPDIYSLLMDDEPTAQEKARALAEVIRGKQAQAQAQRDFSGLMGAIGSGGARADAASLASSADAQEGEAHALGQQLASAGNQRLTKSILAERNANLAQFHQGELDARGRTNDLREEGLGRQKIFNAKDGETVSFNPLTGETTTLRKPALPKSLGGGVGGGGSSDFSPAALDQSAWAYLDTKQMPSLGSGKSAAALKVKIANRAAELDAQASLSGNAADFKANSKALSSLQEQKAKTDILENTSLKNLDVALEQAGKLGGTGLPIFDAPYQEVKSKLGSADMSAYNAARQTAVGEAGKLLAGSTGSGGLSEGARHEVETLIAPGASLAQIKAAVGIIKRDIANRQAAASSQIEEIRGRMHHHAGSQASTQPQAAGGASSGAAHPHDSAAVQWAKANPNDPRAAKILQLNGGGDG